MAAAGLTEEKRWPDPVGPEVAGFVGSGPPRQGSTNPTGLLSFGEDPCPRDADDGSIYCRQGRVAASFPTDRPSS